MVTIQDVLKMYYETWNEAFKSKSDVQIRFTGCWSKSAMDKLEQYDSSYDVIEVLNCGKKL